MNRWPSIEAVGDSNRGLNVKPNEFKNIRLVALAILLVPAAAIAPVIGGDSGGIRGKITAFVAIPPQAYFVERVGGSHVDVSVLIPPGQSHETYDPTPKDLARLFDADLYFQIGLPFEDRILSMTAAMTKRFTVVDTRVGITLRQMDEPHRAPDPQADEGGRDPHIWLDPQMVKIQARHIRDALIRLDSIHAGDYNANYATFAADLDRADSTVAAILAPYAGAAIYVYHPAYGYLADRYHLRQVAVEVEGKEPGAARLGDIIAQARKDRAATVFVQREVSSKTAEAVAREISVGTTILDPLAYDYLNNLVQMATIIRDALSPGRSKGQGVSHE